MKLSIIALLSLFSFSAFGLVDSKNCPESFEITYTDIMRAPLSPEIEDSWSVKAGWSTLKNVTEFHQTFAISTRTNSALCVYTNGKVAVFLQTNDGVDELAVPYNHNLFFRTKIVSFSKNHIDLNMNKSSLEILAQILVPDSDGGAMAMGEVAVGEAQSVQLKVLR